MISGTEASLERWQYLPDTIRNGRPPMLAWEWLEQHPGGWKDYQAFMIGMAHACVEEITARVKLPPNVKRLIDLGGGHGLYSIAFCRKYPDLSATVFDWPQAKDVAVQTIHSEGMEKRVVFQEGDLWEDDYGSGYDAALLFQVVHMYTPEKNIQLFLKVWNTLNPNGCVVINDQVAVEASSPFAKLLARIASLELLNSVNGQTYTPEEIEGWLLQAGFINPSSFLLRNTPGFGIVIATKHA
jgi:trans-aconitate methyltransferase